MAGNQHLRQSVPRPLPEAEAGGLAADPGALALLRDGSRALARPSAAAEVADSMAAQVLSRPPDAAEGERRLLRSAAPR